MPTASPASPARPHRSVGLLPGLILGLGSAGTMAAGAGTGAGRDASLGTVDASDGQRRTVSVWAAPGLTRNPVSFTISADGRIWVAESDRAGNAVTDTRQLGHLDPVWNDGQLRTIEDRRALIEGWIEDGHFEPDYFTRTEDRVRMVADTDGDGTADTASVFAGGFDDALDGIGSGVLWVDDTLLYTNIPHLWALRDTDGDGRVDEDPAAGERTPLSTGYGIRWCFYGHDLHGLVHGPDGRIWFTVGDRGFNLTTPEGERLVGADRGAVFRCWPDGTGLELVHEGLRNPQELAFDVHGNLFTGDNNCDSGDRARLTLVVDGGDSGWRQDVQSLPSRGPWNREGMWHLVASNADLVDPGRPAWVLPPIAHVGAGPSGFALQPGTGEGGAHEGALMLVDFYGSGAIVHSFDVLERGAWFELTDRREFYRGATVTDIAWGPDGRLYMSDWGGGWSPNPNGRVLVVTNEDVHGDAASRQTMDEVKAFLARGTAGRDDAALLTALEHRDHRVRHAAQMELARRGGWRATLAAPGERTDAGPGIRAALLARVDAVVDDAAVDLGAAHAVWALGQIARRDPAAATGLRERAGHPNPAIRTQVLRTMGDVRVPAGPLLDAALEDEHAPARAAAVRAIGRTGGAGVPGGPAAVRDALLAVASREADTDPVMRHALAIALARAVPAEELVAADTDSLVRASDAARVVLVLALRRQAVIRVGEDVPADGRRSEVRAAAGRALAAMLQDPAASVRVVAEASRAIYDMHLGGPEAFSPGGPVPASGGTVEAPVPMAVLAGLLDRITDERLAVEPIVRRAIEAAIRLAGDGDGDAEAAAEAADRLVRFAARPGVPASWRMLALERLEAWGATDRRERVWGHWIPRPARSLEMVEAALARHETALLDGSADDDELRFRVDRIRARLLLRMNESQVRAALADAGRDPRFRAVLLEEAARRFPEAATDFCDVALALDGEAHDVVRMAAMDVLAAGDRDPRRLLEVVAVRSSDGTIRERQHAARRLGALAAAVDGPVAEPAAERLATLLGTPPTDPDPLAAIRLELYRAALAMPEGTSLRAAGTALDAAWSGRRPAGFGDELLLAGGDPVRGEEIFRFHEAAQCLRCHEVGGVGGIAGPRLTAVGARLDGARLVESVVEPGRTIVPGYGRVAAMPEITDILTPEEVRDVVAYMASLDDERAIRPEASGPRGDRFVLGSSLHVVALLFAVGLSAVVTVLVRPRA